MIVRLIYLLLLFFCSNQSWGFAVAPHDSNYQYDAHYSFLSKQYYEYDTTLKLWFSGVKQSAESCERKVQRVAVLAFIDNFSGAKSAPKEIGTIFTRTTKNTTRLGGKPGEPAIKIKYQNGTEFDMTKTRVKQTEINPYVENGTRAIKFDNALDKKGIKRAPTKAESDWFNSIDW